MEDLCKKRKWEDELSCDEIKQQIKPKKMTTLFGTQLNPETPMPLEWQRCLDIKVCYFSKYICIYNDGVPVNLDAFENNICCVHIAL